MPPKGKKGGSKGKKDNPEQSKKKDPQPKKLKLSSSARPPVSNKDNDEGLNDEDLRGMPLAQADRGSASRPPTPVQDVAPDLPPQAQEQDQPSPASPTPPSSHHASEAEEEVALASPAGPSSPEENNEEPTNKKKANRGGSRARRRTVKLNDAQEEEVKEYLLGCPGLYNKRDAMWAKPDKKDEAWKRLADQLGVDVKHIHTWYKTMRKDLGNLRKKYRKSGQAGWSFHSMQRWDRWEFLMPFVHEVNIRSTPSLQAPLAAARTATAATAESDLEEDEDEDWDRNSPPPGAGPPSPAPAGCAPPPAGPLPLASLPKDPLRAIIESSREQTRDILHYLGAQGQANVDPELQQRIDFGKYVTSSLRIMPDDIYHQASCAINDIVQAALRDVGQRRGQQQKQAPQQAPQPVPQQAPQFQPQTQQQTTPQQQKSRHQSAQPGPSSGQPPLQTQVDTSGQMWQPNPWQWHTNPPTTSVWGSQSCDYMREYTATQQELSNKDL